MTGQGGRRQVLHHHSKKCGKWCCQMIFFLCKLVAWAEGSKLLASRCFSSHYFLLHILDQQHRRASTSRSHALPIHETDRYSDTLKIVPWASKTHPGHWYCIIHFVLCPCRFWSKIAWRSLPQTGQCIHILALASTAGSRNAMVGCS